MNEVIKTDSLIVFKKGLNNSFNYRIPSLITTKKGTLIAAIDARVDKPGDNPNNIDKVIRRSMDNGISWGDVQELVDYPGRGEDGAAATDPSMLEDKETGTIWMIFNHTPGGIGLWNSEQDMGFDTDGYRLLYDELRHKYTWRENERVYDCNGNKTEMMVNKNGDVFKKESKIGNIYLKTGPLLETRTSFLQAIKSDDDGLTWSDPIDLNLQVKAPWMGFIGAGPGRGIQLTRGEYKGRLIFPVYFTNKNTKMSNCIIYSDDHGQSWQRGKSPNDGRIWEGKRITAETMDIERAQLGESQVIELNNGDLKIFIRNHAGKQRTAVAVSKDGGESWGRLNFVEELLDPFCQSTVIKYPDMGDGKERVIFANPAHVSERIRGTVRLSEDGGLSWKYSKLIFAGSYVYSCLTILSNNEIGLLYEVHNVENDDMKVYFTKFNLAWLKE